MVDGLRDFIFLRHGETDWNLEGRIQGNLDIELNATGLEQAEAARIRLKDVSLSAIIASPLARARVTAEIVAQDHPHELILEANLAEAQFGEMQGQVHQHWSADWRAGKMSPKGGESFADFSTRVMQGLESSLTQVSNHTALPLVVAHGGVFWAICKSLNIDADPLIANALPIEVYFENAQWQIRPMMAWRKASGGMM